jgi:hypothetical protein
LSFAGNATKLYVLLLLLRFAGVMWPPWGGSLSQRSKFQAVAKTPNP